MKIGTPKKHISISIFIGISRYPYLIGLHYKGGLYGRSLSLFLLYVLFGGPERMDWNSGLSTGNPIGFRVLGFRV